MMNLVIALATYVVVDKHKSKATGPAGEASKEKKKREEEEELALSRIPGGGRRANRDAWIAYQAIVSGDEALIKLRGMGKEETVDINLDTLKQISGNVKLTDRHLEILADCINRGTPDAVDANKHIEAKRESAKKNAEHQAKASSVKDKAAANKARQEKRAKK